MKLNGAIFPNKQKKSEKSPDFQGTYNDESGKEFSLAIWKKTDKNGNGYYSFAVGDKKEKSSEPW